FFTDFLGLLLLLPPVQKHLTVKLMPHLRFSRMPGGGFSAGTGGGNTFDGEYQRKDDDRDRLDHKDDRQD
ncbi:membrane protein FxsA, partial [Escherichia coli]|nr:membrane protein FxsA [Escherichia coli]EFL4512165.1 membrane protein FxsA [Escherichia fergusonii]EFF9558424.1 membrane protein FxsA [Escherichia coli]EFG9052107.1 membrane protein FxsA [Escherichia coli]EFI6456970.1 membrane protein FxsA [Escherichia coli]